MTQRAILSASLLTMFKESDKVVCVDDAFHEDDRAFFSSFPVKDQIYVVRGLLRITETDIGVYIVGINGAKVNLGGPFDGCEWPLKPSRFRKLNEIKAENALARQCVNAEYIHER